MAVVISEETQKILTKIRSLEATKISLINHIESLEVQLKECKLVLDVFEKVEPTRKCYHMNTDILIPQTVETAKPIILSKSEKLSESLKKLSNDLMQVSKEHSELTSKLEPMLAAQVAASQVKEPEPKNDEPKNPSVLI